MKMMLYAENKITTILKLLDCFTKRLQHLDHSPDDLKKIVSADNALQTYNIKTNDSIDL